MGTLATISGVAMEPGVSRNGRLYTVGHVRGAYRGLAEKLKSGGDIPAMYTSHADRREGNVQAIAGAVRKVSLTSDDKLRFEAEIADNFAGQGVFALISGKKPMVNAVSLAGLWQGDIRQVLHEGQMVDTADGVEILGIEFCDRPGLVGARIDQVRLGSEAAESAPRALIFESVEGVAVTQVTEASAANKQPFGAVTYADPGYQQDKVKRYPLDSKAHVKAAWSYINMPT